jgi:hypothetical protein
VDGEPLCFLKEHGNDHSVEEHCPERLI